jgi:hypothetical protein
MTVILPGSSDLRPGWAWSRPDRLRTSLGVLISLRPFH